MDLFGDGWSQSCSSMLEKVRSKANISKEGRSMGKAAAA